MIELRDYIKTRDSRIKTVMCRMQVVGLMISFFKKNHKNEERKRYLITKVFLKCIPRVSGINQIKSGV